MTLVERLREDSGRRGPYEWEVVVWRSDTTAKANLRVRLNLYRVTRRRILPDDRSRIYRETDYASASTVAEEFEDARERGDSLAERFRNDRQEVLQT